MINAIRYYDGAFEMSFEDEDAVGMAEIASIASGDTCSWNASRSARRWNNSTVAGQAGAAACNPPKMRSMKRGV